MRPWLVPLLIIVLALLSFGLARNYRYSREAGALLKQARREAWPAMTYEDAARWLERNGFRVLTTEATFVGYRGVPGQEQLRIVSGVKRLGIGSLLIGDRWAEIEFRFTEAGRYADVTVDSNASPLRNLMQTTRPTTIADYDH